MGAYQGSLSSPVMKPVSAASYRGKCNARSLCTLPDGRVSALLGTSGLNLTKACGLIAFHFCLSAYVVELFRIVNLSNHPPLLHEKIQKRLHIESKFRRSLIVLHSTLKQDCSVWRPNCRAKWESPVSRGYKIAAITACQSLFRLSCRNLKIQVLESIFCRCFFHLKNILKKLHCLITLLRHYMSGREVFLVMYHL